MNNLLPDPKYPKNKYHTIPAEITHRLKVIDFHIEMSKEKLLYCDRYFDHTGSRVGGNLQRKTRIAGVEPDMIFCLETSRQREWYLYEYENTKDLEATWKMVDAHLILMLSGEVQKKFAFDYGYRVLVDSKHTEKIQQRVTEDERFNTVRENFLFRSNEQWVNAEAVPRQLYYE